MTRTLLPIFILLTFPACTGGGSDPSDLGSGDPLDPTTSPGSPLDDDGTQVGGEGTEPTPTCAEADGLPLDTAFEDGTTVADALDRVGPLTVPMPLWFDGRRVALEVDLFPATELRIDAYCNHLVDADVRVDSADGAVEVDAEVSLVVSPGRVVGRLDQPAADWLGALDETDVLGEVCVEGAVWKTYVEWNEGGPIGQVSVKCNPWSGGGGTTTTPLDDTGLNDTGLNDTGSTDTGSTDGGSTDTSTDTTDTTDTTTSTLTGTTTGPNEGGDGEDGETDPQLGQSVPVVSW